MAEPESFSVVQLAIRREMKRANVKARPLSVAAELGETAVRDILLPTTSDIKFTTLAKLAACLGVPVGALASAAGADTQSQPWTPTDETLERMLGFAQQTLPANRDRKDDVARLAHALGEGIRLLAEAPEQEGEDGFLHAVERTIARALRNYKPQIAESA